MLDLVKEEYNFINKIDVYLCNYGVPEFGFIEEKILNIFKVKQTNELSYNIIKKLFGNDVDKYLQKLVDKNAVDIVDESIFLIMNMDRGKSFYDLTIPTIKEKPNKDVLREYAMNGIREPSVFAKLLKYDYYSFYWHVKMDTTIIDTIMEGIAIGYANLNSFIVRLSTGIVTADETSNQSFNAAKFLLTSRFKHVENEVDSNDKRMISSKSLRLQERKLEIEDKKKNIETIEMPFNDLE